MTFLHPQWLAPAGAPGDPRVLGMGPARSAHRAALRSWPTAARTRASLPRALRELPARRASRGGHPLPRASCHLPRRRRWSGSSTTSSSCSIPPAAWPSRTARRPKGRHRRFDSAMDAIEQFITYRKGDAFGLTIFSRHFIHWLPLTLDTQSILLSRRFIEPNNPQARSAIHGPPRPAGCALGPHLHRQGTASAPADLLAQRPTGDRMIILMTDGESPDIMPPLRRRDHRPPSRGKYHASSASCSPTRPSSRLSSDITRATGGEVFNAVTPEALARRVPDASTR